MPRQGRADRPSGIEPRMLLLDYGACEPDDIVHWVSLEQVSAGRRRKPSSAMRRELTAARQLGLLRDRTMGRRARTAIFLRTGEVVIVSVSARMLYAVLAADATPGETHAPR